MIHRSYRRRSDRLEKLAELLRTPGPQRPGALAEQLQVSVPTLCRDVAELQMQGLPIEGNAGSGWRFLPQEALGPMSFSHGEVQALLASVRIAGPQLAPALAQQAAGALERLLALLPPETRAAAEELAEFAPAPTTGPDALQPLETLRLACEAHRKLQLRHQLDDGRLGEQRVRPLACSCRDGVWTLDAWSEEKERFESFRLDRLADVEVLAETFEDEPGRTLAELRHRQEQERDDGPHATPQL